MNFWVRCINKKTIENFVRLGKLLTISIFRNLPWCIGAYDNK